ncbi:MAG: creatininase family protein [Candidatus Doudnabacteria bacterium]|nr:creatininase family protein [Candidatus Doudnabacteria bacterium]
MFLKSIKISDLQKDQKYNFLVPIGSTEQHGPFLPFGTDTYSTDEFVKRIEKNFPGLIVLPTLEYSCSGEHEGFIGTVWLQETTLISILADVIHSLAPYSKNILLMSGHGGNLALLQRLVESKPHGPALHYINLDEDHLIAPMEDLIHGPLDAHAGNIETSMMMRIAPHLVQHPDGYVKTPIIDPWETGKLLDKSKDGIADTQEKWTISKTIGEQVIDLIVSDAERQIKNILEYNEA